MKALIDKDRHIPWFELKEACEKPGCPLCAIVSERTAKYIDNLLFEHVTDRGFRYAFRAAGGFCREHSAQLAGFRDGLAVAILYRDILEDETGPGSSGARKRAAWKIPKIEDAKNQVRKGQARCPVCIERDKMESNYLTLLAEADADLRAAFMASDGLCLAHWRILNSVAKRVPSWLSESVHASFARLKSRVDMFISLSSYDKRDEFSSLSGRDQVVWKELLQTLTGRSS